MPKLDLHARVRSPPPKIRHCIIPGSARMQPNHTAVVPIFQVVKFSWFSSAIPSAELVWVWGVGLGLGAVVKAYDSRCMRKRDIESYRASHILWHFQMPLVFILYNVYRVWKACGEIW